MPKANAASKRPEAERAAEWYAIKELECVVTRRALRTKFAKVDFFASDVLAKRVDGSHVYIQVTAGQASAVTARRRKLEKIPWHESDTVQLLQLVQTEDPANSRKKLWFFRVHKYEQERGEWWTEMEAVPVPRHWFKAWKGDETDDPRVPHPSEP